MKILIVIGVLLVLLVGSVAQENEPPRDYSAGSYSYTLAYVNQLNDGSDASKSLRRMIIDVTVGTGTVK